MVHWADLLVWEYLRSILKKPEGRGINKKKTKNPTTTEKKQIKLLFLYVFGQQLSIFEG